MENIIIASTAAVSYLLYHIALFLCYAVLTDAKRKNRIVLVLTFIINYGVLFICSITRAHLSITWILFALILVTQVKLIYKCDQNLSLFLGVGGAMAGLTVNMLTHSMAAILMRQPMSEFGYTKTIALKEFEKAYPSITGFLLSAILLILLCRYLKKKNYHTIDNKRSLKFMTLMTVLIFSYLNFNLLIYSIEDNEPIIKFWGMKIALCALIIFTITVSNYVMESRLNKLKWKSYYAREELHVGRKQEQTLEGYAYTDTLTGQFNREYANNTLTELINAHTEFSLCFVDLNGLKIVNDKLGHEIGDKYLTAAAYILESILNSENDALCRYGGDEFVLIFRDSTAEMVKEYMKNAVNAMEATSHSSEYPFALSISYGIVAGKDYETAKELLEDADRKMYVHKRSIKDKQISI